MMNKRLFDIVFKKMAIELSEAKESVKEAGIEPGIDLGRISIWMNQHNYTCNSRVSTHSF